ncbi:MAG: hypothetical protein HYR74_08285 [Candidatus Eisenbacteria bacterium]|nr:hypothetical protein [Candidatus Eisenbacteria bacterium]
MIQSLAPASSPAPDLDQLSSRRVDGNEARPGLAPAEVPRPRVTPLAPQRSALQTTIDQETEDLLREAHELLGHPTPTSHVPDVLRDALRLYVAQLRKNKFAATEAPRPGRPRSSDSRHIPAEVKRAVYERDGGRCTFVSLTGHRCEERSGLEFDHIEAYARGGSATASNIRLRCRAQNHLEAERVFGAELMRLRRERARLAAAAPDLGPLRRAESVR